MQTLKTWMAFFAGMLLLTNHLVAQDKFTLPALPYSFSALEPYIDAQTMQIHHDKHHQAYVTNLNKALSGKDSVGTVEELLKTISTYSDAVRNNAGGHYNHSLFWTILTPTPNTQPSERLTAAIIKQFGSVDSLKMLINDAASKRFGSGWAWLSVGTDKKLFVSSTPNQDNPLMDVVEQKGTPILGIDVWEHAYYLKYQNKRGDYLSAIWKVINWNEINQRYDKLVPKGKFDDWPAIKDFHKVMSQTFHPSEEGNLAPIKSRSKEMIEKAEALKKSTIPTSFKKVQDISKTIDELIIGSKKLDKLVKAKASDKKITDSLTALHDVFHKIVGLCSDEDKE
jgi:superoxide dismutase/ribosomal protein L17